MFVLWCILFFKVNRKLFFWGGVLVTGNRASLLSGPAHGGSDEEVATVIRAPNRTEKKVRILSLLSRRPCLLIMLIVYEGADSNASPALLANKATEPSPSRRSVLSLWMMEQAAGTGVMRAVYADLDCVRLAQDANINHLCQVRLVPASWHIVGPLLGVQKWCSL